MDLFLDKSWIDLNNYNIILSNSMDLYGFTPRLNPRWIRNNININLFYPMDLNRFNSIKTNLRWIKISINPSYPYLLDLYPR